MSEKTVAVHPDQERIVLEAEKNGMVHWIKGEKKDL